jgi:hypothetical protein
LLWDCPVREVDATLGEFLRNRRHGDAVADVLRTDGEYVGEFGT